MPDIKLEVAKSAWTADLIEFGLTILRPKRKELGMSQREMAECIGLDQSRISDFEINGERSKDPVTVEAIIRCYQLTEAQGNRYHTLVFPSSRPITRPRDRGLIELYDLSERLYGGQSPHRGKNYDYFNTVSYPVLHKLDNDLYPQIKDVITWLLQDKRILWRSELLVAFAADLMHVLNEQGHYRLRLELALATADAAQELDQRAVEGWLRSDAIPWTLMAQTHHYGLAFKHLQRGLELARELKNKDMEAINLTFQAQNFSLRSNPSRAREYLDRAANLSFTAEVQRRIYGAAGDIAFRQRLVDEAISHYDQGVAIAQSLDRNLITVPNLQLRSTHLEFSDSMNARNRLLSVLNSNQSPTKRARALFTLAILAKQEGNTRLATIYTSDAIASLRTADESLRLTRDLRAFQASLSRR